MSLSPALVPVVPTLAKVFLKTFLGSDTADIAGSALTVALRYFAGEREKAVSAEKAASAMALAVLDDLSDWFDRDFSSRENPQFYAQELVDTLERGFSEKGTIDSALDPEKLAERLIAVKQDDWRLSGEETASAMSTILRVVCGPLSRLVPELPKYKYERDHVVLSGLQNISSDVRAILDGQRSASDAITALAAKPDEIRLGYEEQYKAALCKTLNYVEILGLGLKRDDRVAALSTAYLSLTVENGDESDHNVMQFEEVLQILPLFGGRLLLEGAAGSGKSTLLRWAAIHYSSRPSTPSETFAWSHLSSKYTQMFERASEQLWRAQDASALAKLGKNSVTTRTEFLEQFAKPGSEAWPTNWRGSNRKTLVPFLVRLRDLRGGQFPSTEALPLTTVDVGKPPEGWVSSVLNEGRAIILIDGVDEISEQRGARAAAMAAVRRLVTTFPANTFIVAGRPGALGDSPFGADEALKVTVNEMDDEQRREFVQRWHRAKAERQTSPDAAARALSNATKLTSQLAQNSALRRMAANPLLAASICALHDINPTTVPHNEYELCERLAKMLVSERDRTEDEAGHSVNLEHLGRAYNLDYADKRTVISRIAYQMLQNGDSTLSFAEAENAVHDILPRLGRSAFGVSAAALVTALAVRSGVLRPAIARSGLIATDSESTHATSTEGVEFVHNRFKEWFAAISYRDRGQPTELAGRLPEDPYDQVALFAVAADGAATFSNDLMKAFNLRFTKEPNSTRRRAMKLAAVRLSEVALVMDTEWRKWAASLQGELFPPSSRAEARALSQLGDTAVPYLKYKREWNARQAGLAAYCLRSIGSPSAVALLNSYLQDPRWTVATEAVLDTGIDTIVRAPSFKKRVLSGKSISGPIGSVFSSMVGFNELLSVTHLDLSFTSFSDFPSILPATNIHRLNLSGTRVLSIDGIGALAKLRELYLNGMSLRNYRPIQDLQLTRLYLRGSDINDLASIGAQSTLELLDVSSSALTDISAVQSYPMITDFYGSLLALSSYSPVGSIESLKRVVLSHSIKPVDISHISSSRSISSINLTSSEIINAGYFSEMKSVSVLNAGYCRIYDASFLADMSSLLTVVLDGNPISHLPDISKLNKLRRIDIDRTEVRDIRPALGASNVTHISAVRTPISNFDELLESDSLKRLYISAGAKIDEASFRSRGVQIYRLG